MSANLTIALCERHELLWLRLGTLLRQVEAIAVRRPAAPVPPASRAIAEALLYDAQAFGPAGARRGLVAAAADSAGLAAQLGQALAALEAFEITHSAWDPELRARAWLLPRSARPVLRLRPELALAPRAGEDRQAQQLRRRLLALIDAKYESGYDQGYRDGRNGVPADAANARPASPRAAPEQKMSMLPAAGL